LANLVSPHGRSTNCPQLIYAQPLIIIDTLFSTVISI